MLCLYENNKLLINLDSLYHCSFCDVSTWLSRSQWIVDDLSLLRVGWASLVAQMVKKICLQCRRPWFDSWVKKIPWRRDRLLTPVFLGFPGGSAGEESACSAGDLGLIPGSGRSPWRREWQPTPVLLPGEFHGQRSLVGYSPQGCKELDMTERL